MTATNHFPIATPPPAMTPIEWAILLLVVIIAIAAIAALIQNPELLTVGLELID